MSDLASSLPSRVQLVFPAHSAGHLAREDEVEPQPPIGPLTLASHLQAIRPDVSVEVYDGKRISAHELVQALDADLVGMSVWFSNYDNAKSLALAVKAARPRTTIVFGGPHASAMPATILRGNPAVDMVAVGDGETVLSALAAGTPPSHVRGLHVRGHAPPDLPASPNANLDSLPPLDLDVLRPPFLWHASPAAMSAFPFSGIRGCMRRVRCEYCSIPTLGVRVLSPERYWRDITSLHEDHGIDFFFETGDIFPPSHLRALAAIPRHPDVRFRIYSYPGILKDTDLQLLPRVGVRMIFIGIESALVWNGSYDRRYARSLTPDALLDTLRTLDRLGVAVIPGFILGLPGETRATLQRNVDLIRRLARFDNVHEITVSPLVPLPGAQYFDWCLHDQHIQAEYRELTGSRLGVSDDIDFGVLSELFINRFTAAGYPLIHETVGMLATE